MLSPKDIQNASRKSGYDHVGNKDTPNHPQKKPFQADIYGGKNDKAGRSWFGPTRATALEAAQDYCDYVNSQQQPQQPKLKSAGHNYVTTAEANDAEYEAALGTIRDHKAQQEGKQGYVYLILDGSYGKVGFSTNPRKRVAELQTGNPRPLTLHAFMPGTEDDEKALHAKYIEDNVLQEWFRLSQNLYNEWPAASAAGDPKEVKAA